MSTNSGSRALTYKEHKAMKKMKKWYFDLKVKVILWRYIFVRIEFRKVPIFDIFLLLSEFRRVICLVLKQSINCMIELQSSFYFQLLNFCINIKLEDEGVILIEKTTYLLLYRYFLPTITTLHIIIQRKQRNIIIEVSSP